MSLGGARRHQMFPVLDGAQIETAKRFASGDLRRFAPGEAVFGVGDRATPSWLVLEGTIEVTGREALGEAVAITTHGAGQLSGELSQLAGRAALANGRAGPRGCSALPFDAAHLRALMVGSAELGEIVMRAFILRRVGLIQDGIAGSVLVGRPGAPDLVRLQGFLARNGYPYTMLDAAADEAGRCVVERMGVQPEELPLMICPNGTVLKRPSDAEAGVCLGITPDLDPATVYDVTVVGAGPAGLATAVYAASEGLSVLVLDQRAFGGQAGASARIENYLGFPTGISGEALAGRAFTQAVKFGAEIADPARGRAPRLRRRRAAAGRAAAPAPHRRPRRALAHRGRRLGGALSPARDPEPRGPRRAPASPTGRRRSRPSSARARRWRWSAAATRRARRSSTSRPRSATSTSWCAAPGSRRRCRAT